MPVRLLDSSSPVDSTLRGITSGRTGTLDRRPPCLVRLFFYTTGLSKMILGNYLITFNHYFSMIISKFQTTDTVQFKVLFFVVVCYRVERTSHSTLQQLYPGGFTAQGSPPVSFCCQLPVLSVCRWGGLAQSLAVPKRARPGRRLTNGSSLTSFFSLSFFFIIIGTQLVSPSLCVAFSMSYRALVVLMASWLQCC